MAAAPFQGIRHDHHGCVREALAHVDALCRARGLRLTPTRRRVFEIVWSSHRPIGAYAILDALAVERIRAGRGRVAPATVYRALDFLLANGLLHRVESRNAYVGCAHPGPGHDAQLLICEGCGEAAELADAALIGGIDTAAARLGFVVAHVTLEARGLCPHCRAHWEDRS